ncbi:MAG: hypothetical protein IIB73_04760 [Proteobacteria bacterium]|nr:hypothetical protein [Pseudomonadota bacterium]
MSFSHNVWIQLKNTTAVDIQRALLKDDWIQEVTKGAIQAYRKVDVNGNTIRRVTIHVHPKKTYGAKLLKGLIIDIGWTEDDLRRLKLIKR